MEDSLLKLTSHSMLHYLWSVDLSKSFSRLIVPIFTFLNQLSFFFQSFYNIFKSVGLPHITYIVIH